MPVSARVKFKVKKRKKGHLISAIVITFLQAVTVKILNQVRGLDLMALLPLQPRPAPLSPALTMLQPTRPLFSSKMHLLPTLALSECILFSHPCLFPPPSLTLSWLTSTHSSGLTFTDFSHNIGFFKCLHCNTPGGRHRSFTELPKLGKFPRSVLVAQSASMSGTFITTEINEESNIHEHHFLTERTSTINKLPSLSGEEGILLKQANDKDT